MGSTSDNLRKFLASPGAAALVEVAEAKGSTPREQGAWMLVSADAIFGTIGGGQLEFLAIDKAREVLGALPSPLRGGSARSAGVRVAQDGVQSSPPLPRSASPGDPPRKGEGGVAQLDIPLGPEIGQCCGGRVALSITLVDEEKAVELRKRAARQDEMSPHVYLFGGGHVGRALADALDLLPLNVSVVETRAEALAGLPETVASRLTPVPEETVRDAPPGSAYIVLTHDHALDFLIVAEALRRPDAAYVGMIGSKTKRETFRRWYLKEAGGTENDAARLVCPIGGGDVIDKRPAVIAALTAAEVLSVLASR